LLVGGYLFDMKIIISENKLVKMIDSVLGDDSLIYIHTIKNFWDADNLIRYMFPSKGRFDELVDKWGPFHWVRTKDNGKWLAQKRNGEWFIYRNGYNDLYGMRIDERELLTYMGVDSLGIPLDVIIDNYSYEY
jgi:hypothetical protein